MRTPNGLLSTPSISAAVQSRWHAASSPFALRARIRTLGLPVCRSHALTLLRRYYQGELQGLHEEEEDDDADDADAEPERAEGGENGAGAQGLHGERLGPRARLPPLLTALGERPPERLHYLGVAFGLTAPLFKFWERAGFAPVYLRQVGGPSRPARLHD